jgi:hypothetical protein
MSGSEDDNVCEVSSAVCRAPKTIMSEVSSAVCWAFKTIMSVRYVLQYVVI